MRKLMLLFVTLVTTGVPAAWASSGPAVAPPADADPTPTPGADDAVAEVPPPAPDAIPISEAQQEVRQAVRRFDRAEAREEAEREARREAAQAAASVPPHLQAIAQCESGGDPAAIGGGGQFRGKYQFTYATWAAVGGQGDPAAAPEAEQDRRAAMLYAQSGPGQWPVCGQ
jgi:hypothetical protein